MLFRSITWRFSKWVRSTYESKIFLDMRSLICFRKTTEHSQLPSPASPLILLRLQRTLWSSIVPNTSAFLTFNVFPYILKRSLMKGVFKLENKFWNMRRSTSEYRDSFKIVKNRNRFISGTLSGPRVLDTKKKQEVEKQDDTFTLHKFRTYHLLQSSYYSFSLLPRNSRSRRKKKVNSNPNKFPTTC
jgi:hypothetical protein